MKRANLARYRRRVPLAVLLLGLFPLVSQAADRSGKEVVDTVCITCHGPGKDGAPKIGDRAEWAKRASKGLDKLNENAITGVRRMPAHGGQATLTDLEMTRGVAYLVSGGAATDPQKPYTPARIRSGEQVVKERCQECHADGKNGAPKIGDIDAWKPRLQNGVAPLVNSAIGGHKGMPARGGMASLSDAEIRAAVNYMVGQTAGAAVKQH
ncbi:cytochrome c5 family protein [Accumulibacter sp.]|uniref:c-type cytochrome n=1 Tax=Accumulibacter sp. TaxID=2053492 RepID=UPI0035ADA468